MSLAVYPASITTWHRVLTHGVPSGSASATRTSVTIKSKPKAIGSEMVYNYVQHRGRTEWPVLLAFCKEHDIHYMSMLGVLRLLASSGDAIIEEYTGGYRKKILAVTITTTQSYVDRRASHGTYLDATAEFLADKQDGAIIYPYTICQDQNRRNLITAYMRRQGLIKRITRGVYRYIKGAAS